MKPFLENPYIIRISPHVIFHLVIDYSHDIPNLCDDGGPLPQLPLEVDSGDVDDYPHSSVVHQGKADGHLEESPHHYQEHPHTVTGHHA